ncbi:hypothetical protein, partial [Desulfobacula sp.]|uniref:hypothetical protein n=1 Tax=Desulfobacula sp. TaxID=2593537 RepID=UPI0039B82BCE
SFLPAEYDLYASLVTPCRLASGTLLMARDSAKPHDQQVNENLMVDLGQCLPYLFHPPMR